MLDDDDGVALVREAAQGPEESGRSTRIEIRERLVHHEESRLQHQDPAHREQLAFAAGECRRLAPEQRLDAGLARDLGDPLADLAPGRAEVLRSERELALDRGADDLAGRILEHRAHEQRDVAELVLGRQPAPDLDSPGQLARISVRDQPVHRPDEGALATARWPGDEQDLAGRDRDGEVTQGGLRRASIAEGEVGDLDDRLAHRRDPDQAGRIVTGRSTPTPSLRAASAWLSAKASRPEESSNRSGRPAGISPNVRAQGTVSTIGPWPFVAANSTRNTRPGLRSPTALARSSRSPARRRLPKEST